MTNTKLLNANASKASKRQHRKRLACLVLSLLVAGAIGALAFQLWGEGREVAAIVVSLGALFVLVTIDDIESLIGETPCD